MNDIRPAIFEALSESLKEPSPDWKQEVPEMIAFLSIAFDQLQLPIDLTKATGALANAPDLSVDFGRSFLFPVETRVVPVESIYRVWTADSSATVSFAHSKGYLMSDAALHMKHLYELYDLQLPVEFSPVPDHVCLELEFAAMLLHRGENGKYALFLREHLDWIAELANEAEEKQIPLFYRSMLQALAAFVSGETKTQSNA